MTTPHAVKPGLTKRKRVSPEWRLVKAQQNRVFSGNHNKSANASHGIVVKMTSKTKRLRNCLSGLLSIPVTKAVFSTDFASACRELVCVLTKPIQD
jgi:hypothetical protein